MDRLIEIINLSEEIPVSQAENNKNVIPKNPKRITTSNIDKDNKLSKKNRKIIQYFRSVKE